jgi:uncharacterized protein YPO0396
MPSQELNFSADSAAPRGWRLERLEMVNWGTFGEQRVHALAPGCGWSLLIGENGSGKSTAIDALRTLLAPRGMLRHSFNDAAGGQKKQDRSLVSYIRGAWSASRDEEEADVATQYLRKEGVPSYLLAVFRNIRTTATLTLAQILWVENGKDEPVFLLAAGEKSIAADLADVEIDRGMRKMLGDRGFDVRDTYKAYREDLCARMGIPGIGALEIFNQAIGVKEVSDVGIFLRRHLLAPSEVGAFVRERVIPQFENLESCWNDIARAKAQIELLGPVAAAHALVIGWEAERRAVGKLQELLIDYYTARHALLLRAYLDHCVAEHDVAKGVVDECDRLLVIANRSRDNLLLQIDGDKVGQRIRDIETEMERLSPLITKRRGNHEQLRGVLREADLEPVPESEAAFVRMREQVAACLPRLEEQHQTASDAAHAAGIEKGRAAEALDTIKAELETLHERRMLIPYWLVHVRDRLAQDCQVDVTELPFAGELMEVKPEYAEDWSGAIERLLHNFGVSLLVPERHYQRVANWINGRRLMMPDGKQGLRLVFHRVSASLMRETLPPADARVVEGRLNFRTEHHFAQWVQGEVRRSFPHVCCRDVTELEGERFGITSAGLIRYGTRHVKDDSRAIGNRGNYVLGWSPEQKLQALEAERDKATATLATAQDSESEHRGAASRFARRKQALDAIITLLPTFAEIDFASLESQHASLATKRLELEQSSHVIRTLREQLQGVEKEIEDTNARRDIANADAKKWKDDLEDNRSETEQLENKAAAREPALDLDALSLQFAEIEGGAEVTHRNLEVVRERAARALQGRASGFTVKIKEAQGRMVGPMRTFIEHYPEEAFDLDDKPEEYAADFVAFYEELVREALPQHEERFRDFLNTNLTENIGGLEDKLNTEVKAHRERIAQVNAALAALEYSPGTFVEIDRRDSRDVMIREFKAQLRDCLSSGLHPNADERLELYKKIREIVTRFTKEPEWSTHVTDSRLWLDFGVRVKNRNDGSQVDYLGSSTGKSGGQKAKLAFTILAASLLAQYGLAELPERDDSLRLVVVDEVFARTDEENSRRALDLFRSMGFQLLIAAPWKAEARIAEKYVDSFHLTLNPNNNASQIQRATRAQYEQASQHAQDGRAR